MQVSGPLLYWPVGPRTEVGLPNLVLKQYCEAGAPTRCHPTCLEPKPEKTGGSGSSSVDPAIYLKIKLNKKILKPPSFSSLKQNFTDGKEVAGSKICQVKLNKM